jgi:hypothetical protein
MQFYLNYKIDITLITIAFIPTYSKGLKTLLECLFFLAKEEASKYNYYTLYIGLYILFTLAFQH